MPTDLFKKGLNLLLRRQTNILSAAFIIMATVILSQILGLVRQRLLVSMFGASNTLGIYLVAAQLPDSLFQLVVAAAISTAFIPVFTDYLSKGKEKEGHQMASTLIFFGFFVFLIFSIILSFFAPFFLQLFNLGSGYTASQMGLMANLMRIIIFAQTLFIIATFFSALLQSYNHFFIPGIAAALYNFGIIVGLLSLSKMTGIYAPAIGNVFGALFFILMQLPLVWKIGFRFKPEYTFTNPGVMKIWKLMWPRTIAIGVSQVGTIATIALVSFLASPGRNYTILDYARTLAFAPVVLFGQTIAQAAFPVLAREKDKPEEFKMTFITSFNQTLYLVLPIAILMLVLRIPIVRLIYGAQQFDWPATVLTGRTLAWFSFSIFAQSLINLVSRAFYALHNTIIPLFVGFITTIFMLFLAYYDIITLKMGIGSIAISYSIGSIIQLVIMMILLDRKTMGFNKRKLLFPIIKIFVASFFTGIALYIPIKLLDRLVFDTTKTINLLILTGISSLAGLCLYLFLTWLFNVSEAVAFLMLFKKMGNWKDILRKVDEKL